MVGWWSRARRRPDSGAAAVEFALVVPLLLLLVFGIISYGVMLSLRQSMSQAATEGARAAVVTLVEADKRSEAIAAVSEAMSSLGVSCDGTSLHKDGVAEAVGSCAISHPGPCTPPAAGDIECITVTLTYDYEEHPLAPNFPGLGILLPDELSYEAQARVS